MRESHNSLRGCIPSNLKPPSKPYLSKFPPPYNSNGLGLRLLQSGNRETLKNIGVTVCTWKQKAQSVCPWTAGAVALNSVRYEEPCGTSSSTCAMCTMAFLKRAIKKLKLNPNIFQLRIQCVCIQDWVPWGFCGSSVNPCKSSNSRKMSWDAFLSPSLREPQKNSDNIEFNYLKFGIEQKYRQKCLRLDLWIVCLPQIIVGN